MPTRGPDSGPDSGADTGVDEWRRTVRGWHVAFGTLAALTCVLILTNDEPGAVRRYAALGGLLALAGWYAAVGAPALAREQQRAGLRYVAGAVPLTVAVFALDPVGSIMLFMLYPHVWALLPMRRAVAATVVALVATAAVTTAEAGFSPEIAVMVLVGLVVALALGVWITRIIEQSRQRAQLVADLAATRAELAEVSRRAGAMAERERLAHDVHDTLAQGFTSVLLLLQAAESEADLDAARHHICRAQTTARENLAEARALIADLAPPALHGGSLPDALAQLVERLSGDLGVRPSLAVRGDPRVLPAEHDVVLLRVAQEALANVRKHADASRVDVSLRYDAASVVLRVTDDGRGFDLSAVTGGFGLSGMRARVEQVGGGFTVRSASADGTTVEAML
ncbi:sensor histidine kinase [Virgisporangium aurantiacum]|uniref:Two-component sensor histidine kinase n=1 Tax=Virgisporangium aurantiacum TaxID=175570 RepID=A0A8J3Z729_9ACTN|nr:sensor histidine kinase [Virgisporangium aurantiacum]GIJ58619.1 two-component sensor histidine kinase [Virgisporangium aurantiacum]